MSEHNDPPICRKCVYFEGPDGCNRLIERQSEFDPIDGRFVVYFGTPLLARIERGDTDPTACGPEGKFFVAHPPI